MTTLDKLFSMNPTLIGRVAGWSFYEHPTRGDEAPLLAINPAGEKLRTDHWELPDACEL